jgi:hypothetical protein
MVRQEQRQVVRPVRLQLLHTRGLRRLIPAWASWFAYYGGIAGDLRTGFRARPADAKSDGTQFHFRDTVCQHFVRLSPERPPAPAVADNFWRYRVTAIEEGSAESSSCADRLQQLVTGPVTPQTGAYAEGDGPMG